MRVTVGQVSHRFTVILAAALLVAGMTDAQDSRARVQGIVTDPTHAVLVGALVRLHNDNTGVDSARPTNENGVYVFDLVDPGTYSVIVEHPGFAKFIQQGHLGRHVRRMRRL